MAKKTVYMEGDENKIFHKNYTYMWKKLNTTPYYVRGMGKLPKWIKSPELLPSYVNLTKCNKEEYIPSMNLVNKIVQFYNENVDTQISTYQFLHEHLEFTESKQDTYKREQTKNVNGLYYGYYYSGNPNNKKIYGIVFKISENKNNLIVQAISGFTSAKDLKGFQVKELFESDDISFEDYKEFKNFKKVERRRLELYKGTINIKHNSICGQAQNVNEKNQCIYLKCTMKQEFLDDDFCGGMGFLVFIDEESDSHFLKVAIQGADNKHIKTFDFEDEGLKDILCLQKSINEHVHFTLKENKVWMEMLWEN